MMVISKCQTAETELRKTGMIANDIILDLQINSSNYTINLYRKQLEAMVKQISFNNVHFSAAGVFRFDYTVLLVMTGVVISYFIIFLQFSLGSKIKCGTSHNTV